ncbi:hypothetical protein D9758_017505 [Tetrapyrgos nigripes]|uniref:L-ornithine N(5)-monooxygenase [NAD(P)H] n=1 Tax=Tetrapyrgos nigripes TaxID=182062 RepID=A0A8H5B1H1_9AGAR|nr:hypothetical protein D9758_017505 [Tetrapyrgos nigripes]
MEPASQVYRYTRHPMASSTNSSQPTPSNPVNLDLDASNIGGTWYWNTYPGARVDTELPAYQLSIPEVYKDWTFTEKYPDYKELQAYFAYVDQKLDLRKDIFFESRVKEARWDEEEGKWMIGTEDGKKTKARWFVMCTGIGSKHYVPQIKGLERFKGERYHTARWPKDEISWKEKRVGVIGTGASGVQRTPNLALPMRQQKVSKETQEKMKRDDLYSVIFKRLRQTFSGFEYAIGEKKTFDASPEERRLLWELYWQLGGFRLWVANYADMLTDEKANDEVYAFWRDKTRERIHDERMKEKLAPMVKPHPFGTKRPSLEQRYYEVYNQPNVALVDLSETPIEEITEKGVKCKDGKEYELDILLLATRFDAVTGGITTIDVRGTDGQSIGQKWQDGVATYLGMTVTTYPNMFFLYGPQGPTGLSNGPPSLVRSSLSRWFPSLNTLRTGNPNMYMHENGYKRVEADSKAEEEWRDRVVALTEATLFPKAKSWYMGANVEGKKIQSLNFAGGVNVYRKYIKDVVDKGVNIGPLPPGEACLEKTWFFKTTMTQPQQAVLGLQFERFLGIADTSRIVVNVDSLLFFNHHVPYALWSNPLIFPGYATVALVVLLVLHISISLARSRSKSSQESRETVETRRRSISAKVKAQVERQGGGAIFGFMVLRALSALVLLVISVKTFVDASEDKLAYATAFLTFGYSSVLAFTSLLTSRRWSNVLARHINTVHLVAFAVYAYRDLYPLTTFTEVPQDAAEGNILWVKVAILTFVAVVIPLSIPRQYIPYNPNQPERPNPEQTASILSSTLYNFMDPIILKTWNKPNSQIDREDLPPLADYDYAYNLRHRMFPHLDPMKIKRRSLFFSLMRVFRADYMGMFLMLFIRALSGFSSPIAVNQLLQYVEKSKQGIEVLTRPWVWIAWLFIGPMLESISFEWYIFLATRALVRAEAILTQLVFEHALRIRMKSETGDGSSKDKPKDSSLGVPTPETAISTSSPSPSPIDSASEDNEHPHSHSPSASENATLHIAEETESTAVGTSRVPSPSSPAGSLKKPTPATPSSPTTEAADDKKKPDAANLVGKMNNLVTSDLQSIVDARDFGMLIFYTPIQIVLCIIFLYIVLGWSSFVGLATIVIMFPIPGYLVKLVQRAQKDKMKKTDARIETVTETMNVLRMVKMFGWERLMNERIAEKREEELKYIRWMRILDLTTILVNHTIPILTMLTLVMKEALTASKVFSSMVVFEKFQFQLRALLFWLNQSITAKVSLDRITNFLYNTELLDVYKQSTDGKIEEVPVAINTTENNQDIGFCNATFTWSNDSEDGTMTPSRRRFQLHIEELLFKRGCINLIIGPTGCGKTSMLMALLSEMHFVQTHPDSWYNLPRDKGVAYAAQESWVQNATIKENIVFRSELDEERYKKVLYQCALERDLTLFEAGDATEVGAPLEKGLTLSGGQKARITLARAVYSDAEIILLDDVLAALDVHTSKWIVDKCLKGDLIRGRTILLVTHNIVLTQPIAEFVISIKDGRVASQGSISDALVKNSALVVEADHEQEELQIAEETIDTVPPVADAPKSDGKLIVAEEVEIGHIGWPALAIGLSEFTEIVQTWFLGHWAEQYEKMNPEDVDVVYYLGIYVGILVFVIGSFATAFVVWLFGAIRSSRSIHKQLVSSVLGTTFRWLDTTPTSRVITRCTKDMSDVDRPVPMMFSNLIQHTLTLLSKFIAVIFYTPVFVIPGILVAALGGILGQIYIQAQLPIKRLQSNAKAPVLGHFGAAITGLTSIRAYGVQESFKSDSLKFIDFYSRPSRTFYNLNRWIDIRVDVLANMFAASLAAYLVYLSHQTASNVGFSLNMAVGFSTGILWWIRFANIFETQANSLERINRYIDIEQEPKPTDDGRPPAYWPSSGELRVEKLSSRYSPDGPKVLRDISFSITSGERIGVVGRTGSGKSSLMLSLLRCIYTEGSVFYDGIRTASLNLENLRTNITIIPQVPELLSGSVRKNLDPFNQYDDAILNDALRSAGLQSVQSEEENDRITLDTAIASGGSNLSVGQRQILALARAMVRGSKLLILDEDYKTDSVIQSSLRNELKGDVTLITVAHRLQTIMDADKIMVLDAGNIVEFDKPSVLLQNPEGKLRALVDESADKDHLYEMAGL